MLQETGVHPWASLTTSLQVGLTNEQYEKEMEEKDWEIGLLMSISLGGQPPL